MTGLDQFLDLFGNITVLNLVQFILAVVFIVIIFKKIKDYLDDKQERMIQEYEKNKERDRKLQIALDAIDQYPKYRQQRDPAALGRRNPGTEKEPAGKYTAACRDGGDFETS